MSEVSDSIDAIRNTIMQLHSLMPDSILFGSLLLYIITHNMSYGIFAFFIMELILSHKIIGWLFKEVVGSDNQKTLNCRVGYHHARLKYKRIFSHNSYPSYGIFSITAIGTYLGFATKSFGDTLSQMGTNWEWRSYIAYLFIALVILLLVVARIATCETTSEIGIAFVLAIVTGSVFFLINKAIFGIEAMNFLGLPYLVNKDSDKDAVYICAPSGAAGAAGAAGTAGVGGAGGSSVLNKIAGGIHVNDENESDLEEINNIFHS